MTVKSPSLKLLFTGIILFTAGLAFILHKLYGAAFLNIAIIVMLMLSGVFTLYLSMGYRRNTQYFISGIFLCLASTFIICSDIIFHDVELKVIWPVFMLLFGLILFVYSIADKHSKKIHIMVPAVAICILAVMFIPFSLKLITVSLFKFVAFWWPVLFCVAGGALMVIYFSIFIHRSRRKEK